MLFCLYCCVIANKKLNIIVSDGQVANSLMKLKVHFVPFLIIFI